VLSNVVRKNGWFFPPPISLCVCPEPAWANHRFSCSEFASSKTAACLQADWICSRGTWTERGFEVLYMGGPDEDTPQVNNSGYFNVGSMIVLRSAVALGKQLGPSMGAGKKLFWSRFDTETVSLPRQAQDKHKKS
jgi:hypothetical protein